ncbi:MAG: DSBA oxidoreductase [Clostridia bacterium 62_21]|nr:MAG: DSBA oxidoreductase [Clostridia bacterium 62_21]
MDEWIGYELHPETPAEGIPLERLLPGVDAGKMLQDLRRAGEPYGINFAQIRFLPNTRLALEASEYAREKGKFAEMHTRLFQAYFLEERNIGERQTILRIGREIGLDERELDYHLVNNTYSARLQAARRLGQKYGVTGLPTFIFSANQKIVGARSYETFREAAKMAALDREGS